MQYTRMIPLMSLALAAFASGGTASAGGEVAMDKPAYEAAQERIERDADARRKACKRLKGHQRDVCLAQAKGEEKTLKAQLEAQYEPGPDAEKEAKYVKADAEYDVAKVRCEAARGKAKDACLKTAKAAREAAIRQAKVEKVESVNEMKAKARAEAQREAARKPAPKS